MAANEIGIARGRLLSNPRNPVEELREDLEYIKRMMAKRVRACYVDENDPSFNPDALLPKSKVPIRTLSALSAINAIFGKQAEASTVNVAIQIVKLPEARVPGAETPVVVIDAEYSEK